MCGITGIFAFNNNFTGHREKVSNATSRLIKRGPDSTGTFFRNNAGLGHTRLAIIDTSVAGSQPFTDETGRYTIVYNGEFYNFKEYRRQLSNEGFRFKSDSDTEVLLYLYIRYGAEFLTKVNGCFALAIYDNTAETMFIARDRVGINPLLYYRDNEKFIFASEMKAIMAYNIPREIDNDSLSHFFQFNYIPPPFSIYKNVFKLIPGTYIQVSRKGVSFHTYYSIRNPLNSTASMDYGDAKAQLKRLTESSVERRLVSDVPLGTFLSGGIDSSVITAVASQYSSNLNTFSIGYRDEPFFDETYYSDLVAKTFKTNHHKYLLSNDDLLDALHDTLDYTDEPFADSSALAVNILCKRAAGKIKVALSGDGADELFSGYHKHFAHLKSLKPGFQNFLLKHTGGLFGAFPQSRNSRMQNFFRQLCRYSEGLRLEEAERYWRWCIFTEEKFTRSLLHPGLCNAESLHKRKQSLLSGFSGKDMNEILKKDMQFILPGDMLQKVDLMSMANSLEVRTPFLDHHIIDFAFSLPAEYKINKTMKKRILQDSFRDILPEELYNRPKKGFEVPLDKWFKNELYHTINNELLDNSFIVEQQIFNPAAIELIKNATFRKQHSRTQHIIWALVVFQSWWNKYHTAAG